MCVQLEILDEMFKVVVVQVNGYWVSGSFCFWDFWFFLLEVNIVVVDDDFM